MKRNISMSLAVAYNCNEKNISFEQILGNDQRNRYRWNQNFLNKSNTYYKWRNKLRIISKKIKEWTCLLKNVPVRLNYASK